MANGGRDEAKELEESSVWSIKEAGHLKGKADSFKSSKWQGEDLDLR